MKKNAARLDPALVDEMYDDCLMTRARLIARVVTNMYDGELRPFGINAPQMGLLTMIAKRGPICRADIGRLLQQDRSTLTRNMKVIDAEGWIEEVDNPEGGRGRPIVLSRKGETILVKAAPAWRTAQKMATSLIGREGSKAMRDIGDKLLESA
ncbi:MarR family winged helix-turn-helix transcriptional regulator [Luteibacter sp. HA06]|jgi:DNA-binding MarR family transcriptional regulator